MYSFLNIRDNVTIRILTTPFQYTAHNDYYVNAADGVGGQRALCSAAEGKCKFCGYGHASARRWMVGAICREDQQFYLVDLELSIFVQMRNLVANPRWGLPSDYDVEIVYKYDDAGYDNIHVIPYPKQPLTRLEQELMSCIDLRYLNGICDPTKQKAAEKMESGEYVNRYKVMAFQ